MGEQPSTKGLWLQGVPAAPAHTSWGGALLCCFLSAERNSQRNSATQRVNVMTEGNYLSLECAWQRQQSETL